MLSTVAYPLDGGAPVMVRGLLDYLIRVIVSAGFVNHADALTKQLLCEHVTIYGAEKTKAPQCFDAALSAMLLAFG